MVIELYLQESPVGSGRRRFVVLAVGPKWAELFYPTTCQAFTVPKDELRRAVEVPATRFLAKLIRNNIKAREGYGYRVAKVAAKRALEVLA